MRGGCVDQLGEEGASFRVEGASCLTHKGDEGEVCSGANFVVASGLALGATVGSAERGGGSSATVGGSGRAYARDVQGVRLFHEVDDQVHHVARSVVSHTVGTVRAALRVAAGAGAACQPVLHPVLHLTQEASLLREVGKLAHKTVVPLGDGPPAEVSAPHGVVLRRNMVGVAGTEQVTQVVSMRHEESGTHGRLPHIVRDAEVKPPEGRATYTLAASKGDEVVRDAGVLPEGLRLPGLVNRLGEEALQLGELVILERL